MKMAKKKAEKQKKKAEEKKLVVHKIKSRDGKTEVEYTIIDEIRMPQSNLPTKELAFQKLHFKKGGDEFRFAYYNILDNGWKVFGRFVCNIPGSDLQKLLAEAKTRRWW